MAARIRSSSVGTIRVFLGMTEALGGYQQDAVSRPQDDLRFLSGRVRLGLSGHSLFPAPVGFLRRPLGAVGALRGWVFSNPFESAANVAATGSIASSYESGPIPDSWNIPRNSSAESYATGKSIE
jgi:hypothetical protein